MPLIDSVCALQGPSVQTSRLLQYVEAPPYLRKKLFPVHKDLKFAGLMQPVDAPHHMQHKEDRSLYREGIVTDKPAGEGRCVRPPWIRLAAFLLSCGVMLHCIVLCSLVVCCDVSHKKSVA